MDWRFNWKSSLIYFRLYKLSKQRSRDLIFPKSILWNLLWCSIIDAANKLTNLSIPFDVEINIERPLQLYYIIDIGLYYDI